MVYVNANDLEENLRKIADVRTGWVIYEYDNPWSAVIKWIWHP